MALRALSLQRYFFAAWAQSGRNWHICATHDGMIE
jgi:hypothetical protein